MLKRFLPEVDQAISIEGRRYRFDSHPAITSYRVLYVAEGARARIYRLIEDVTGREFALKAFLLTLQDEAQASVAVTLRRFARIEGMRAASRSVITEETDRELFDCHRELRYAVVMPWIGGGSLRTWAETFADLKRSSRALKRKDAHRLASRLLAVMSALEERGTAHTDISAGNVVCDPRTGTVELIDLEELFVPGAREPRDKNRGSPGYRHRAIPLEGLWSAEADRFSAAVLAAEMLAACEPKLVAQQHDNHLFFQPDEDPIPADAHGEGNVPSLRRRSEIQDVHAPKYRALMEHLRAHWPAFAALFEKAWTAPSVADAPTLTELAITLGPVTRKVYVTSAFLNRGIALSSEAVVRAPEVSIPMDSIEGAQLTCRASPHAGLFRLLHPITWVPFLWLCFGMSGPSGAVRVGLILPSGLSVLATFLAARRERFECVITMRGIAQELCLDGGGDPRVLAQLVAAVRKLNDIARNGPVRTGDLEAAAGGQDDAV